MTQAPAKGVIPASFTPITGHALTELDADKAAVQALLQAAVNVENFTLPLYLCAMSSIYGTHSISNSLTVGRLWPGMKTTPGDMLTPNQQAYNTMFSVFIQEMLHLQLAANLAVVLGVKPRFFDGTILKNSDGGWGCYGKNNTVIPHIIDLTDTTTFSSVKVNLDALTSTQIDLFLAIEQSHDAALKDIKQSALDKYFPAVPFAGWKASNTEKDLPLFGTIGWMYNCLLSYLAIEYSDGKTLWEKMFDPSRIGNQRDVFNGVTSNHPQPEYTLMPTKVTNTDTAGALWQAIDIVKGICDQGEGGISSSIEAYRQSLAAKFGASENNYVQPQFQPNKAAMIADYPDYNAAGNPTGQSSDADARATGDMIDHWQRFNSLKSIQVQTFAQWFAAKNSWTAADLQTKDYTPNPNLPTPQEVATALNNLKSDVPLLSNLVVGSINGINQTLDATWENGSRFPNQAMRATGDRMSLYWAVIGTAPDLSKGLPAPTGDDTHACQGLDINNPGNNHCAALSVYHTCGGSNSCKGQGGCGYPRKSKDNNYPAPSDNTCAHAGGCGAPISVWQIYQESGTMDVISGVDTSAPTQIGTIPFSNGEKVYDTAWAAFSKRLEHKNQNPPAKPDPRPIRVVLPPN